MPRPLLVVLIAALLLGLPLLLLTSIIDQATQATQAGAPDEAALRLSQVVAGLVMLRRMMILCTGLALGIAALVLASAALRTARGIALVTRVAARMAGGDLSARSHARGHGGLAALGQALDDLGAGLSRTLEELRGERDLLSGVLRGMQEGVLLLEGDGRIAMLNPALQELLFRPDADPAVGRLAVEVIRNADLMALLAKARTSGSASGEIELAGLRPRRALVRAAPLKEDPAGRVLAVFVDVTELRRLESLRRDFVANVSHELRTPVASIRSATETLQGPALRDPEAAARFCAIIDRNAERLHRLVEDLLDLSRIESRAYRLTLEPLSALEAARGVQLLLGERALRRRQTLKIDIVDDLRLRADRRALEQVLVNLVDNAIRHCPEGTAIAISAEAPNPDDSNPRVRLLVRDNGQGIAAAHLPRLFERFYRVDAGRSREQGGTGLGLAIVKHLCEAMGGSIDVASQPGQGTVFTVRLPAAQGITAPLPA